MSKIAISAMARLAQSAYQAYRKKASELDEEGLACHAEPWDALDPGTQQCWMAVALQLLEWLTVTNAAEITQTANDIQHGGQHYKGLPIEPWDYIVANGIGFLEGNAIKYLTRWKEKNGVEDLHKALHYVQKAIEVNTNGETAK